MDILMIIAGIGLVLAGAAFFGYPLGHRHGRQSGFADGEACGKSWAKFWLAQHKYLEERGRKLEPAILDAEILEEK